MDISDCEQKPFPGTSKASPISPTELPRYQQIAYDIAAKIANGTYPEGQRTYVRSALASQYGVSSETARRAICVLSDLGIVKSAKGSGITIISAEKAADFVQQFRDVDSINDLRRELRDRILRHQSELQRIGNLLDQLLDRAERFHASNPLVPYQYTLAGNCRHLGRTLQELNFWHNTLATVVAIRRNDRLILSPGPFEALYEGDTVYYIGNHDCIARVHQLLADRPLP